MKNKKRWCFGICKDGAFRVVEDLKYVHHTIENPVLMVSSDNEVEYFKAYIMALKECNIHNTKLATKLGYDRRDNEDDEKLEELFREHSIIKEIHWAVDSLRWYGIDPTEDDEYLVDIYNYYSTTTFEEMEDFLSKNL